jgi:hypothetical protein
LVAVDRMIDTNSECGGSRDAEPRRTPGQARCDSIQAAFRGGGAPVSLFREPPPRPDPLELTDDPLQLRLAEELDYAARMLALMGDDLAADMGVVIRHSVVLQSIDIVGQMLGHIASVVRSLDPDAAVDRIGMGDLKARLVRKGSV